MWIGVKEVADKCGKTSQTIINWFDDGQFTHTKKTKGGHRRIWAPDGNIEQSFADAPKDPPDDK